MKIQLLLIWLLCIVSTSTWAIQDFAKTPQEEAMCQVMVYNGHDTSDRNNWQHMHHYCDCIRFTNRAYSRLGDWNKMRFNLNNAIDGCDYVLGHTTPSFYMRPEVHLQKGKALLLYKKEGMAAVEFMKAIEGNPALAQAYLELADIQTRDKKRQEALKTVSEGLRQVPDYKPLQRRYTALGGKLPYPEPVKKTEPASAVDAIATDKSQPTSPQTTDSPASGATSATSPSADPSEKIGVPGNPYCRFCP